MGELQVKVFNAKPAEVEFNHEELLSYARSLSEQYKGLIFCDETIPEAKATVAEINKIVKSVNDWKVKTKKELNAPILLLEKQCKEIMAEFDEPKCFIKQQIDVHEIRRLEQKREWVNEIINNLRVESGISDDFWNLEFNSKWLNKTTKKKDIEADVTNQINQMIVEQNNYATKLEVIESQVEFANAKFNLNVELSPDTFYHLAKHKESKEIKEIILAQAETQKNREDEFARRTQEEAERKARLEARAEADKLIQQEQFNMAQTMATMSQEIDDIIPVEPEVEEKRKTVKLQITGTKGQFDALVKYLEKINVDWSKI